jgi:beta-galactosidase
MTVQNPKLWRPDSPERYRVRAYIVRPLKPAPVLIDETFTTIGIRKVQVARGDVLLNARRLILKAVTWNEDHPAFGSALPFEQRLKDLVDIRDMGANAVRFAFHPPHPVMLELCDSLGLFALEEIPLSGLPAPLLRSEAMMDLATTMAREMVLRDRNHPSVLAWGLGNENESFDPGARPFAEALAGAIRGLDARPLYYVSFRRENDEFIRVADMCGTTVDETSDPKALRSALEEWRNLLKGKPVFVAQLGREVQHANRKGYADPLSQQSQARYFLQRLDLIRSLDYDGVIVWAYNDWRGSRPSLTVHAEDPWLHSVGLVSRAREHRLAYDAVRSSFLGEKYQALPMGTYASPAPIVFVLTGFLALLAVAYLYNASRRFRECLLRSVRNSYNFFADVRDQHLVSGLHSAILGALAALTMAIVFSSILYHFRGSGFLDSMLSFVLVSDGLKATVIRLIRAPLQFIAVFSALLFGGILLLSGAILVMRAVFRSRVFPYHAYSIVTWSTPPILLLIPVGMILYRVMESPLYILPALIVVVVLHCWVVLRLLKGISIVFDVPRLRVHILGAIAFIGMAAILYAYYDLTAAVPMYLSFMYDVVMAAR